MSVQFLEDVGVPRSFNARVNNMTVDGTLVASGGGIVVSGIVTDSIEAKASNDLTISAPTPGFEVKIEDTHLVGTALADTLVTSDLKAPTASNMSISADVGQQVNITRSHLVGTALADALTVGPLETNDIKAPAGSDIMISADVGQEVEITRAHLVGEAIAEIISSPPLVDLEITPSAGRVVDITSAKFQGTGVNANGVLYLDPTRDLQSIVLSTGEFLGGNTGNAPQTTNISVFQGLTIGIVPGNILLSRQPLVVATTTPVLAVPDNVITVIQFAAGPTSSFDPYNIQTGIGQFTVPTTSIYKIQAYLHWADDALPGARGCIIRVNGSSVTAGEGWTVPDASGRATCSALIAAHSLTAGDVVELAGYQTIGVDLNVFSASLSIELMGS